MSDTLTGLELRSTATSGGRIELSLANIEIGDPGPDEIVVRVEAAPINPSDLGLLLGPADVATLEPGGTADRPTLSAAIPPQAQASVKPRLDQALPVGNEGAGVVVEAGENQQHLVGRVVGILGGGMYAQYRKVPARDAIVLPEGATAAEGAALYVNPLTALGFVETMRMEGYKGLIHWAAASNLGQMLNRICLADGVPLINVVRSDEQARILRDQGATTVLNSSDDGFDAALTDAIAATGIYLAFDPIGGGRQASRTLAAMEAAASRAMPAFSRYGSETFKQVYLYGLLDTGPTVLDRFVGFSWSVSGWLLTPFMQKLGAEGMKRLRDRVAAEYNTTFASGYTKTLSLAQALDPETVRAYQRKATGEKYLIDPSL